MTTKFYETQYAEAAREILTKYFNQTITIGSIAESVGVSERTLKRCFKNRFNSGLHAYQLQLRMEKAQELLLMQDKSIKQVSKMVGYKRQSNFTRQFALYYGVSPKEWMNRNACVEQ